jgi:hypothetical protein
LFSALHFVLSRTNESPKGEASCFLRVIYGGSDAYFIRVKQKGRALKLSALEWIQKLHSLNVSRYGVELLLVKNNVTTFVNEFTAQFCLCCDYFLRG